MNKTAKDDCYVSCLPIIKHYPGQLVTGPHRMVAVLLKSVYPLRILRPSTDPDVSIKVDLPYHKPLPA